MNPLVIAGVGAAALLLIASGGSSGKKAPANAPRVQRNAMGFYIPIDERHTQWLNVHGNPGAQNLTGSGGGQHLRALLPPDASPNCRDKYSKEHYNVATAQGSPIQTDEYGRGACGVGADFFKTFTGVAQLTLPYIPGVGTVAAAGLGAAIALGQGKSLKDAALAAGYYAIPAHLRFAYSAGVAVANGEPIDQAAMSAAESQYPGALAAYQTGKELAS